MGKKYLIKRIIDYKKYKNFTLVKNCVIKSNINNYIFNKIKAKYYYDNKYRYDFENYDNFYIISPSNKIFYRNDYKFIIMSDDFFSLKSKRDNMLKDFVSNLIKIKIKYQIDIEIYNPRYFENLNVVNCVIDEKNKIIYVFDVNCKLKHVLNKYYNLIFGSFIIRNYHYNFCFNKYKKQLG